MNNQHANKCVLATYGLQRDRYAQVAEQVKSYGVEIEYSEIDGEGRLIIAKDEVDEIALQRALKYLYMAIGESIYIDEDKSLAEYAVALMQEQGIMMAVAESCTGGLLCSRICDVAGASGVFYEGLITYNNASKVRRLHVPSGVIDQYSAVSEPVCEGMLKGVLANKEVHVALATTGYASGMGELDGQVYVGVATRDGSEIVELRLKGDRNSIRRQATNHAIFMLINTIKKSN